jgi:hypothetical protein
LFTDSRDAPFGVQGGGGTVNIKNATSNCGAVLLGELKALVDSFPQHRRKEVIKIIETVFRLSADYQSRHSADRWPANESRRGSQSPATPEATEFSE